MLLSDTYIINNRFRLLISKNTFNPLKLVHLYHVSSIILVSFSFFLWNSSQILANSLISYIKKYNLIYKDTALNDQTDTWRWDFGGIKYITNFQHFITEEGKIFLNFSFASHKPPFKHYVTQSQLSNWTKIWRHFFHLSFSLDFLIIDECKIDIQDCSHISFSLCTS